MADAAGAGDLAPMSERYTRPDWVRRLNAMADAIGADARRLVPLDAADLLDTVRADLGAWPEGDLGEPGWQRHFESLVAAIDAMDLHVVGRLMSRQELLRALRTRLLMTAAVDARPAILDERVAAPLIVTGPARSGTTILFELLGLDPELRAPTAWEALHPVPRPEDRAGDRRRAAAECEQELWADIQPEFAAIHELRSDLPVECITLTAPCFSGSHWPMVLPVETWRPDVEASYRYHRSLLQVLQHGSLLGRDLRGQAEEPARRLCNVASRGEDVVAHQ